MEGAIRRSWLHRRLRLVGSVKARLIVLANGCFDPFHYGHLLHLQAARELGDCLIVSVTEDEHVNKGPGRPVFKLHQRVAMIRALAIVDDVISTKTSEEAIRHIKPHIYVKGLEYKGHLPEQKLVEAFGGKVHFTYDIEGSAIKSGNLLRYYKNAGEPAK